MPCATCKTEPEEITPATPLHVYEMEGGASFYVATSPNDALALLADMIGEAVFDLDEDYREVTPLDDDKPFPITVEDGGEKVTKTCAEWAREQGRGFLAGSDF